MKTSLRTVFLMSGICLAMTGCILPRGDATATSKEFNLFAQWTELKGKVEYEATESRPDGVKSTVKLKLDGSTNLDAATQAKIAEQQMILNSIAAGVQLGQTAINAYTGRPASQPAN